RRATNAAVVTPAARIPRWERGDGRDGARIPTSGAGTSGSVRKRAHGTSGFPRRRPYLRHTRLSGCELRDGQVDERAAGTIPACIAGSFRTREGRVGPTRLHHRATRARIRGDIARCTRGGVAQCRTEAPHRHARLIHESNRQRNKTTHTTWPAKRTR